MTAIINCFPYGLNIEFSPPNIIIPNVPYSTIPKKVTGLYTNDIGIPIRPNTNGNKNSLIGKLKVYISLESLYDVNNIENELIRIPILMKEANR